MGVKLTDVLGGEQEIEIAEGSALERLFGNLAGFNLQEAGATLQRLREMTLQQWLSNFAKLGGTLELSTPESAGLRLSNSFGFLFQTFPQGSKKMMAGYFGEPFRVPQGQTCVSFSLKFGPGASFEGGFLGLEAGQTRTLANYRCFGNGDDGKASQAVEQLIGHLAFPDSLDALRKMDTGLIATVDGARSVKATADFAAGWSPMLLTSRNAVAGGGGFEFQADLGGEIGVSFELKSGFQLRARKKDGNSVELGIHRRKGHETEVSASLSAGVSAQFGGLGFLDWILGVVRPAPRLEEPGGGGEADIAKERQRLKNGLSKEEIEAVNKVLEEAINRQLNLSLSLAFASEHQEASAFAWELDLAAMDGQAREAVEKGLGENDWSRMRGDLKGVTLKRSIFQELLKKKQSFKLNLLGLFSFGSLSELLLEKKVVVTEDGEVTIADRASAERFGFAASIFGDEARQLRRLIAESMIMTAVYRGSGMISELELKSGMSFFKRLASTGREEMKSHLQAGEALNLVKAAEKQRELGDRRDFGTSTVKAELELGDRECRSVFLRAGGKPRNLEDFVELGKRAHAQMVRFGDRDDFRRIIHDPGVWRTLASLGFAKAKKRHWHISQVPGLVSRDKGELNKAEVGALISDFLQIQWWAKSMAAAAEALEEARKAVGEGVSRQDPAFRKARETFAKKILQAVAESGGQFGEPLDLIAFDIASGHKGDAAFWVTSAAGALFRERKGPSGN